MIWQKRSSYRCDSETMNDTQQLQPPASETYPLVFAASRHKVSTRRAQGREWEVLRHARTLAANRKSTSFF